MEILKINLDIVFNGLTEHEEEVLQNVKEKYFKNLGKTAWDTGIWNLDEYNKMIKNWRNYLTIKPYERSESADQSELY